MSVANLARRLMELKTITAGRQLQVFNLGTKTKLGSHLMNEDVSFWTWINDTTLGLVTDREVHHWKVMEGQASPSKVRQYFIPRGAATEPF
jgi:clathrin heavy chain